MTTRAFAELVLQLCGENQQDFPVDRRVVLAAAQVIIIGILSDKLQNGGEIPGSYYKRYKMNVKYDGDRERKYVEFDPPFADVGNNQGLIYIGAAADEYSINSSYVIIRPGQIAQYAGLPAQHLGGRPAVAPEGNTRGYLYNEPLILADISVLMIPQITKLKEDDEMFGLDLTPDGVPESGYVLTRTVNLIMNKRSFVEDKGTDGTDATK